MLKKLFYLRAVCQVTPYLHCVQCEKSYHGAPNEEEGKKWGLPMAVGNDYLRPETSERRNDNGGGYSSATKWHYTLPLYSWVEGESLEAAIKRSCNMETNVSSRFN